MVGETMSYDVYLRTRVCEYCGHAERWKGADGDGRPEPLNPTYNLTPIFDLAITGEPLPSPEISEMAVVLFREKTDRPRGLRLLNDMKAKDSVKTIQNALGRLTDPELKEKFLSLEPSNKWGTVPDAIWVINKMLEYCERWPELYWDIR